MYLESLGLDRYGVFSGLSIPLGRGLTVVVGPNESGKSTALTALADLVWGPPQRHPLGDLVPRAQLRLTASVVHDAAPGREADRVGGGDRRGGGVPLATRHLVRIGRGLFAEDGVRPVDNPWGTDGEDQRSRWLCCFGLSHQMLREGGQQILAGAGDLAELVFTARQGTAAQRLLKELDQQADQLFKSHRGNKGVLIRVGMEEYGRRKRALDEAVVQSSTVMDAEARVRERAAERDAAVTRETETRRWWSSLVERQRCLKPARELTATRRALITTRSQGAALDQAGLDIYDQASTALTTAEHQRADLRVRIDRLAAECEALTVDEPLLADGETLDALHAALEARLGDAERAKALITDGGHQLEEARRGIRSLTGRCDDRPVAVLLDELGVPADLATQLDEAARRHVGLVSARETALARVDEERAALGELPTTRELPQPGELAPLLEILAIVDGDQSPLTRVRAAQRLASEERTACRLALVAAGSLAPDGPCPTPPAPERLQREIDDLDAARHAATRAEERLTQAEHTRAQVAADLEELDGHDVILEPRHLKDLRAERDTLWAHIRRSWLTPSPRPSADVVTMADGAGPAVMAADFDRLLRETDHLADRLVEQAELVARRDALRVELAAADAEAATRRSDRDRRREACQRAEEHWDSWWAALDTQAPSTTRAEAVRGSLNTATMASVRALQAEGTVAATTPEIVTIARRLRAVLTALNRPQPEPDGQPVLDQQGSREDQLAEVSAVAEAIADLDLLLASARTLADEVDQAREDRERHRAAERALKAAHDKVTRADQAIDGWSQDWRELLAAAGLPEVLDPSGWQIRHQHLVDAGCAHAEAQRQRAEADGLLAAWASFAGKAVTLGQRHQVGGEPGTVLETLRPRLAESRANLRAHQDRHAEIATATARIADLDATATAARTRLDDLRIRHAIDTDELLAEAAGRGREIIGLLAGENDLLGLLRTAVDPGHDPEELVGLLAEADAADLDTQCLLAQGECERARERREQIVRDLGAAEQELRHLTRDGDAATRHALAQEQLAEVADLTERYAVAHLQRVLLRTQLEIDASRHASPLLEQAGRILEQLTDGRWVALRANDDGADRRCLEILRGDGEPFADRALSEGTADQVFLALRLASIVHRQVERHRRGQVPLPVVFDDVLMTFDDHRVGCALRAMAAAASGVTIGASAVPMQLVVFTHHAHVAELAAGLGRSDVTVTRLDAPPTLPGVLDPDQVRAAAAAHRTTPTPAAQRAKDLAAISDLARMNTAIDERAVDPSEVRAWARTQGIHVADRGRVSAELIAQYRTATGRAHPDH